MSKLDLLTERQKKVIYYVKQGLDYIEIGEIIGFTDYLVQGEMNNIYEKLGYPKKWHWTQKRDALKKDYFPLIPDSLDEFLALKEVKEDVEDTKPRKAVHRRQRNPLLIPFIIVICLLLTIVGGGVGYILYFGFPTPQVLVVSPTTGFTADIPQTSLPSPTLEVIPPVVATDTPTPINTQKPTATVFVPPADGILFKDNFENGINSDWRIINGNWIVSNGELTVVAGDGFTYFWIVLDKPEWKNYIFSVKVNIPFQGSGAQSYFAVSARGRGVGVAIDTFSRVYFASLGSDHFGTDAIAGENHKSYLDSGSVLEIEVNNNNYTIRINDTQIQTLSMNLPDSGGIGLAIECNYSLGCPSFDNVKVTYLP